MEMTKRDIGLGYDQVAERIRLSPKFYRAAIGLAGPLSGSVLDMGCGRGLLLEHIRKRAPHALLYGGDLSSRLAEEAFRRNPSAKIFRGDVEALPIYDGVFDGVFLTEVLEHLLDYHAGLLEIRRVLKPGGWLLVTVPNRDWVCWDEYMKTRTAYQPVDDHWFTCEELQGLLVGTGFQIEEIGGTETLFQRSGLPRLLERIQILMNPALTRRMKRLIMRARKPA